jgi:GTP-binding protein
VSGKSAPAGAKVKHAKQQDRKADPLVIRSLEFLGPMATVDGWRPTHSLPEIAFAGRSNVGKSSLLNALVRRKTFARVSKTPGRTREINFFSVNGTFALVDLPGYGYAKISKERQAEWRPLIEGFLKRSPALRGIVQLLDVRRDPSDDDRQMLDLLAEVGVPTVVCVTKVDKLSRGAVAARVKAIAKELELDEEQVIPFSAVTGEGRDELAEALVSLLSTADASILEPVGDPPDPLTDGSVEFDAGD